MAKKNPLNRRDQLGGKAPAAPILRKEYVYITAAHKIADVTTRDILSIEAFNVSSGIAAYGKRGEDSAFAIWKNEGWGRVVDRITYEPGKPTVFFEGKVSFYNTWRAGIDDTKTPVDVSDDDVAPWLNHVAYIWKDDKERNLFLNWAAFLVQKPGQKVNWAPVLIGDFGVGKDLSIRPLYVVLGKDNCHAIAADEMQGTYQDWAENQLILAEELPSFHKRDVYDWLKRYVATGTPHFPVNKKYLAQYKVRNLQNWFISSNNDDALAIPARDRRYFVYKTPAGVHPEGAAYYSRLAKLFEDEEFCARVKAWLQKRDISQFDPGEPPMWTDAKTAMMRATMAPFSAWILDLFEDDGPFFGRRLITAGDVADYGRELLRARAEPPKLRDKIADPRAIGKALAAGIPGLPAKRIEGSYKRYLPGGPPQFLWALRTPGKYERLLQAGGLKEAYLEDRVTREAPLVSTVCHFPPVEEADAEEEVS